MKEDDEFQDLKSPTHEKGEGTSQADSIASSLEYN